MTPVCILCCYWLFNKAIQKHSFLYVFRQQSFNTSQQVSITVFKSAQPVTAHVLCLACRWWGLLKVVACFHRQTNQQQIGVFRASRIFWGGNLLLKDLLKVFFFCFNKSPVTIIPVTQEGSRSCCQDTAESQPCESPSNIR